MLEEVLTRGSAIVQQQYIVHDHRFVVYTDHSSLRWLMNVKDATGRLARWALLLQQYKFEIIHRPGCQSGNAASFIKGPISNHQLERLTAE